MSDLRTSSAMEGYPASLIAINTIFQILGDSPVPLTPESHRENTSLQVDVLLVRGLSDSIVFKMEDSIPN